MSSLPSWLEGMPWGGHADDFARWESEMHVWYTSTDRRTQAWRKTLPASPWPLHSEEENDG